MKLLTFSNDIAFRFWQLKQVNPIKELKKNKPVISMCQCHEYSLETTPPDDSTFIKVKVDRWFSLGFFPGNEYVRYKIQDLDF